MFWGQRLDSCSDICMLDVCISNFVNWAGENSTELRPGRESVLLSTSRKIPLCLSFGGGSHKSEAFNSKRDDYVR